MATSMSDQDFIGLWTQPGLSSADIAETLGIGVRAVNKRARTLGLPSKGIHPTKAKKLRAQLLEATAMIGGGPSDKNPWLADADVGPVARELWERLKEARTADDIAKLRPLMLKFHHMLALKFPAVEYLQVLREAVRLDLLAQRTEAELPPCRDQIALRHEAARQMMAEFGMALTKEELGRLAALLALASDRLKALRAREDAERVAEAVSRAERAAAAVRSDGWPGGGGSVVVPPAGPLEPERGTAATVSSNRNPW